MRLEVTGVHVTTDAFDHLTYENAEVRGFRVLSLPYVDAVDWMHGGIDITCSLGELPAIMEDLKGHLTSRRAKGEHVQEIFHEWGNTAYTYKYRPGTYPIEVTD